MVKAPTKHGLDRKFKPWRRGKSQKANKRSSLKQQLRGFERLLSKLPDTEDDKDRRMELQQKMDDLKVEISQKQQVILEKKHAEQSHGQRFLDRQKLTRKEKQARKQKNNEQELLKLALDLVYVAHHPNDVKYMPLFSKGARVVDQSRQLYRRAITRRRILRELSEKPKAASWISKDQYGRLPKEWTIQDEQRVFGGSISRKGLNEKKAAKTDDSRFALASDHEALLKAADKIETEMNLEEDEEEAEKDGNESSNSESTSDSSEDEKEGKQDNDINPNNKRIEKAKDDSSSDSSSEDSDNDDEADPLTRKAKYAGQPVKSGKQASSDSSSSEDSDDDDDDEDKKNEKKDDDDSSSDDSSSSSDSDSSDDDNDEKVVKKTTPVATKESDGDEEADDFFCDADNETNVFKKVTAELPAWDKFRGDKSQGWATQRQRPGSEFKRRRVRR